MKKESNCRRCNVCGKRINNCGARIARMRDHALTHKAPDELMGASFMRCWCAKTPRR